MAIMARIPVRLNPFCVLELCATTQEARKILGDSFPFEVDSRDVDLPELQGEPDEVAIEKCRLAVKAVSGSGSLSSSI